MANTNIITGYTYTPVIVFMQVLPGLKLSSCLLKALASLAGGATPLVIINR